MIEEITFTASFGNVKKKVELSRHGGGGAGWHVYIDRYYLGVLLHRHGKWNWYHNQPDEFTIDDITILTDMIDANKKPL